MRTITSKFAACLIIATATLSTPAFAQDAGEAAIKARQSQMQLYAYNLGILGGMAKGAVDYDAAMAQTAADNFAALANMNTGAHWLPGTSSDDVEGSNALAAIWQEGSDIGAKAGALATAATAMKEVAGVDLASLQGAMGALGASCGGCHKAYRQSDN